MKNIQVTAFNHDFWVTRVFYLKGFAGDQVDPPYPSSVEYGEIKPMRGGEILPIDMSEMLSEEYLNEIDVQLLKEFES